MSYLNDYLKVIPTADASKIRTTLNKSQEYFEISRLSDQAFEELLEQLVVSEEPLTKLVDPGTKITADPLNRFYGNVLLDLTHLFSEQNAIERAGENYDIIYQSQLDELKKQWKEANTTYLSCSLVKLKDYCAIRILNSSNIG